MLSFLVYSGKGGVGKTTMTYCMYKAFQALGYKAAVLDMDLNTPSFHHLEESENIISASKNLGLFIETAQINAFVKNAKEKTTKINPDVLLIDSPPSLTQIHYSVIEKFNVSAAVLVTQPTKLSISDVERTVPFFEAKGIAVAGIIENMASDDEDLGYNYSKLASVKHGYCLDSTIVFKQNRELFADLCEKLVGLNLKQVSQENQTKQIFNESIDFDAVKDMYNIIEEDGEHYFANLSKIKDVKFINLKTWKALREVLLVDNVSSMFGFKDVLTEATYERVERLLKAFEDSSEALFMVMRNIDVTYELIIGEIGTCTLHLQDAQHGIPCVQYQTAKGSVKLYPHEVKPIDQPVVDMSIESGAIYIDNGKRLIQSLETSVELGEMDGGFDVSNRWHRLSGQVAG